MIYFCCNFLSAYYTINISINVFIQLIFYRLALTAPVDWPHVAMCWRFVLRQWQRVITKVVNVSEWHIWFVMQSSCAVHLQNSWTDWNVANLLCKWDARVRDTIVRPFKPVHLGQPPYYLCPFRDKTVKGDCFRAVTFANRKTNHPACDLASGKQYQSKIIVVTQVSKVALLFLCIF